MDIRECKRCLLYELADKAAYESVKSYIDALDLDQRINESGYHARLDICKDCDMMLSAMCRKCGCYVEVRAIRPDSHCPASKW